MIALALAAVAALALAALLLRARALRRRHLRLLAEPLPSLRPDAERLIDAPRALHHGTRFADGQRLLLPALADPCVADLYCTEEALFFRREAGGPGGGALVAVPLAWVREASLHRARAELAGKDLPMLRIEWRRGGEELVSEISLRGGMPQLERLRREIHLRQPEAFARLRRFLEAQAAAAGPGRGPAAPPGAAP